ncbi:hypothetical protein COCNU_03G006860 [Cocos nucifera]|uniref:Uncharacterized protein n=1 Tax=Cocos nucifera TaxID=13894 RepID=A0A8K0I2D4_COCNU|nr:hypothetical protein COCNU_03G006860 [Cocos nucifera]
MGRKSLERDQRGRLTPAMMGRKATVETGGRLVKADTCDNGEHGDGGYRWQEAARRREEIGMLLWTAREYALERSTEKKKKKQLHQKKKCDREGKHEGRHRQVAARRRE